MYNSSDLDRQHQLMRLRSAPSSLLAEFRPSSPEAEAILERFISNTASPDHEPHHPHQLTLEEEAAAVEEKNRFQNRMLYPPSPEVVPGNNRFQTTENSVVPAGDTTQSKANLIRHSSSPAGLFSNLMDGYGVMRGTGNFKGSTGFGGEGPISSGSRLKSQMSLSRISEMESEEGLGLIRSCNNGFLPSWDDTTVLPNNFSGIKRGREMDGKLLSPQNSLDLLSENTSSHHSSGLRHQFSLPKTPSEIAAMEKFLQLNDSVPCKIRAKRGCATHPRSIAERVRRTKISDRMRKLQELVPNMDKQTNTADMLDLAVDYIKELQKQVKTLSDGRASCTCSSKLLHCD